MMSKETMACIGWSIVVVILQPISY